MALIKDKALAEDGWTHVGDEDELPPEGGAIVTLARWRAEREALSGRNAPIGVLLASEEGPDTVAEDLDRIDLIAVSFPQFKDGRGYSTGRLLRERYGFKGELRAVGNVLRDQLAFMARCGFDSFEYAGKTDPAEALKAFDEIGVVYQTAADRRRQAALDRAAAPKRDGTRG